MRTVFAVVLLIGGASSALAQQESPDPAPPGVTLESAPSSNLLDFNRIDAGFRVGAIAFSADFESHMQFAAGLLVRAPSPWISRDLFGMESEDVGAFLGLTSSRINRDIDPAFEDSGGGLFFASIGLDFDLIRFGSLSAGAQAGLQYGYFGHVADTHNGIAMLAGLTAGFQVAPAISVTVNPQVTFADSGDRLYFVHLGLQLGF